MIELGKKYKLKKIKGFKSSDNEYYKVIGFYNFDTVICENTYGERLSLIRNKGFKLKDLRNRLVNLYLEKQICRC